jgi:hypothetical protein
MAEKVQTAAVMPLPEPPPAVHVPRRLRMQQHEPLRRSIAPPVTHYADAREVVAQPQKRKYLLNELFGINTN